ncbi:hypothetical protein K493DRAFT_332704 [Basidiobolus meristosporus CBS 931.73]|uniref:Chitin-binding type-4 domain-containing protein n=1 Tax=Basidiobolus meristosporus CBS 931.73 TaxID=1314790 RepID=A0A1Y1ZBT2_9FUNG|nr:hypothetical protein K493DRAFT_332704 [Basidiobolus meristosporus CBS 931.73]|eukprot:ORY07636.1 hypothetical protein K493DRAFT_332704 [Basidiobolus meristosporus CBS 931.73]
MISIKLISTALAALLVFVTLAEAHSWVDCMDWRFKNPSKKSFDDNAGDCYGFARRFPVKQKGGKYIGQYAFGSLDSTGASRHYKQNEKSPDTWPACSTGKRLGGDEEVGTDETKANPVTKAYGGKWGPITVAKAGQQLCVRWPAKNHKNEPNNIVYINMPPSPTSKDPTQKELNKWNIAKLQYGNCFSGGSDKARCGGCFTIPKDRKPGDYLIQWRWMLKGDDGKAEWYTSCSDVQVTK